MRRSPSGSISAVVVGTDRHGAERPRVSVGHALVIHRHVEEPAVLNVSQAGSTSSRWRRNDSSRSSMQKTAGTPAARNLLRRVTDQRVIQAMTNRPLERLVRIRR